MPPTVEVVKSVKPGGVPEGPHWDIPSQTLYFIDAMNASVHSYRPSTDEYHSAVVGDGSRSVSFIIPVEGAKNKFVISQKTDLAVIEWDGKSGKTSEPKIIANVEDKDCKKRINDAKADVKGRIWTGTLSEEFKSDWTTEPVGAFYRIDGFGHVKKFLENLLISNGLTWNLDNNKLYYIDSFKHRVDSYDFNNEAGEISNEKTVFDFKKNDIPGFPDGMTVDAEGKLFVANFEGGQVLRVDPENGKLLLKIPIPANQVTSVAFGGANLDELYVTTGNIKGVGQPGPEDGINGCLYKVKNLGVKGLPMFNVKLNNIP